MTTVCAGLLVTDDFLIGRNLAIGDIVQLNATALHGRIMAWVMALTSGN